MAPLATATSALCSGGPIEECELAVPEGREVECLMDAIKARLRASSTMTRQDEIAARRQAMMRNVPAGTAIPDDLLAAAGACSDLWWLRGATRVRPCSARKSVQVTCSSWRACPF